MKRKIFSVVGMFVLVAFLVDLSIAMPVLALEEPYADSDYRSDFKKDEVAARKYAEKKYNEFAKRLTNKEKIFVQYLEDYGYITLKRLNQARDEQSEPKNPADVQDIDELFDKKASKTLESHVLYASLRLEDLGIRENSFDDGTSINRIEFASFINQFQYFNINGNFLGSLVQEELLDEQRISLKLNIPKNEKIIFFENGKAILNKDVGIIIKRVSIFSEGREYIRLEGDLVPKEKIKQELNSDSNALNQHFSNNYGLQRKDIIKIDAKSYRTNYTVAKGKEQIVKFMNAIPKRLVDKIFQANQHEDFNIVMYDRALPGFPPNMVGLYDYGANKIKINIVLADDHTLIHEFGHAVDFKLLGKGIKHFSQTDSNFSNLFDKEKNNLTPELSFVIDIDSNGKQILYGQKNTTEYFAEVFKNMNSFDDSLRSLIWQKTPETCLYLQKKISLL